jgi:hypothetical protein
MTKPAAPLTAEQLHARLIALADLAVRRGHFSIGLELAGCALEFQLSKAIGAYKERRRELIEQRQGQINRAEFEIEEFREQLEERIRKPLEQWVDQRNATYADEMAKLRKAVDAWARSQGVEPAGNSSGTRPLRK